MNALHRVFALLLLLMLAAGPQVAAAAFTVPSFEQVKGAFHSSESLVLDRDGEPLQRVRTNATIRRGQWLALD
ncbi:MAG: hypothetical protein ABI343_03690, partial [Burkholderiaceae bacterium]